MADDLRSIAERVLASGAIGEHEARVLADFAIAVLDAVDNSVSPKFLKSEILRIIDADAIERAGR